LSDPSQIETRTQRINLRKAVEEARVRCEQADKQLRSAHPRFVGTIKKNRALPFSVIKSSLIVLPHITIFTTVPTTTMPLSTASAGLAVADDRYRASTAISCGPDRGA
jgi:hypothetical protein